MPDVSPLVLGCHRHELAPDAEPVRLRTRNLSELEMTFPQWKPAKDGHYHGVATIIRWQEGEGIIVAPNMRALRKLARGALLLDFDKGKAASVMVVSKRK